MKIGIDVREIQERVTGISRVLKGFLDYLVEFKDKHEVVLFCEDDRIPDCPFKKVIIKHFKTALAYDIVFPRRMLKEEIDVFYSPYFRVPVFLPIKHVISIHDLNIYPFPTGNIRKDVCYKIFGRKFAKKADKIITISNYVKEDIISRWNINPEKIIVSYLNCTKEFNLRHTGEIHNQVKGKYNLPDKFILYVGDLRPCKNVDTILKAFKLLDLNSHSLVIVGNKDSNYDRLAKLAISLGLENKVLFTGYVDDNDLPYIYNLADLFVFPSLAEGFGIPPLEAMASGIPVITSNVTSLPEVTGDAAITLSPDDIEGLSNNMKKVLTDYSLRREMVEKGLKRVKEFAPEKTYSKILSAIEGISGV